MRRSHTKDQLRLIADAHRDLVGRTPTRTERRAIQGRLEDGASLGDELLLLGRSPEYRRRLADRIGGRGGAESDDDFVERAYRELLQRPPDPAGRRFYTDQLAAGMARAQLVEVLAGSDEHVNRVVGELYPLPDLRQRHPERYEVAPSIDGAGSVPCFRAKTDDDFDWIAAQIGEHGYYDRPGIWGYSIDTDKRILAEIVASFDPALVLDLGCSNGAVMRCLHDLGVVAEGIELSTSAVRQAFPEIRGRIHLGSITEVSQVGPYDLISGFDIFEHVTPRDVREVIASTFRLLEPGGYLFANVPAFGDDPVYGTVFGMYVAEWLDAANENRPFSLLHTDDKGFPLHGHLTWAATRWWQERFEHAGFERQVAIEEAVHRRYADHLQVNAPSRRAFYVFAKHPDARRTDEIARRIAADDRPLPTG